MIGPMDIGGPEIAAAEQALGGAIADVQYGATEGEAMPSLGDIPEGNPAQDYADHCTS